MHRRNAALRSMKNNGTSTANRVGYILRITDKILSFVKSRVNMISIFVIVRGLRDRRN